MPRVFLSPPNWLGFERADYFLLALSILLLFMRRDLMFPAWVRRLAARPVLSMGLLFVLPIALRLVMLPSHSVPVPSGADDFGYLLLADTLRHFRLSNPPHAFPEFFQQVFVLQRPTYSSMFNLWPGFVLARGWLVTGQPWAGVLLTAGLLPVLTYWMLRPWTSPGWALAGGLLAALLFGPLCYWTNCYWGGGVAACAGTLLFGTIARFNSAPSWRWAILAGAAFAIHLLTRPFESVALFLAVCLLLRRAKTSLAFASIPMALAFGLIGFQNRSVTGSWTTLPYQLYRYQYGVPATFTWQSNPIPHSELNSEQEADYRTETAVHGYAPETLGSYVKRLWSRVRFVRFFLFAPLYIPAMFGIGRAPRVTLAVAVMWLASNFYPYFYPHYVASTASLFLLLAILVLQRLPAGPILFGLCAAQFTIWYVLFATGRADAGGPTWNYVNGPDPQGRSAIARALERTPGKHLVFMHYSPDHNSGEWVHNAADIDVSRIIFVHDLGASRNEELRKHYPDRDAWILKTDMSPPALERVRDQHGPFEEVY